MSNNIREDRRPIWLGNAIWRAPRRFSLALATLIACSACLLLLAVTAQSAFARFGIAGTLGQGRYGADSVGRIAVDGHGNIYVAKISDQIDKYAPNGAYLESFAGPGTGDGQFDEIDSFALDSAGNIYVADPRKARIQKLSPTGAFLAKWGRNGGDGSAGYGDGEFYIPRAVAVDSNDVVYVGDAGGGIQKFTASGVFLGRWRIPRADSFPSPTLISLAVDGQGGAYAVVPGAVWKLDPSGRLVGAWASSGEDGSRDDGGFGFGGPTDVAVAGDGTVWVADPSNGRIQQFSATGRFLRVCGRPRLGSPLLNPRSLAVAPDGSIYVENVNDIVIVRDASPPAPNCEFPQPVISKLSVTKRFRVRRLTKRYRRAKFHRKPAARGAIFSYDLSQAATVRFALERVLKRGPVDAGSFTRRAKAGRSRIRFPGRLSGKLLPLGRYRARLVATSSDGIASRESVVGFRVVRR